MITSDDLIFGSVDILPVTDLTVEGGEDGGGVTVTNINIVELLLLQGEVGEAWSRHDPDISSHNIIINRVVADNISEPKKQDTIVETEASIKTQSYLAVTSNDVGLTMGLNALFSGYSQPEDGGHSEVLVE